ncbi:hypothetical protein EUX98_g2112 [Antrodiella citrinella]|uniref:Uncharacterized protein n=1 Tax=Antrodiella citrinella TaxID=2447956 RepID=A0A4S4MZU4_9APHY|nr:hypothetical protein EUX98_g2112 [Antrodiella citrinella]
MKEVLVAVCSAIADDPAYPNIDPVVLTKADDLLNEMVGFAYGRELRMGFVPSFAHGRRTLGKDPERDIPTGSMTRFRKNALAFTPPLSPLARAITQARLSVASSRIDSPINLCLPQNSARLGIIGAGGYKDRDPELSYFLLDEIEDDGFCKQIAIECGLTDVPYQIEMDATRKLIYVADSQRIKSY